MYTILIIIAVSLAVLFGLMLLIKAQQNSQLNFQATFNKLVKENKLLLYYKDVFNKKLIGIDRKNKKLLLLDFNGHHKFEHCLRMDDIVACDLIQLRDNISKRLKKVFLEISYKEYSEPIKFSFFNDAYDDLSEKTCLLLKAREWSQRINFHKKYWWVNAQEYA